MSSITKDMTWEEKYHFHYELWHIYFHNAATTLDQFIETHNWEFWYKHQDEYKEANKHLGIARGMWSRKYGKI